MSMSIFSKESGNYRQADSPEAQDEEGYLRSSEVLEE